jgi:hypothetical protein
VFDISFSQTKQGFGEKTGTFWNEIEPSMKNSYIAGIFDELKYIEIFNIDSGYYFINPIHIYDISPNQVVKSLDDFYSDYKNLNVNIFEAIHISQMMVTGSSNDDIEWHIRFYRTPKKQRFKMIVEKQNLLPNLKSQNH